MFDRVIAATVIKVLRRIGTLDLTRADDLIQEVYLKLCTDDYRILRDCRLEHTGALFGLVQAVATTTVLDHVRALSAQKRGGGVKLLTSVGAEAAEPSDPRAHQTLDRLLLISQIDQYVRQASDVENPARDRQIFWLYCRHGFTAKAIASIPALGLTPKGVESVIHRITLAVRQFVSAKRASHEGERS